MRVACLIIAYGAPQVLSESLRVFRQAGWDVFVHLDKKANVAEYVHILGPLSSDLHFVDDPLNVFWGGYSMMEAEFHLIRTARKKADYDRFILISDDTLPLHGPDKLSRLINEHEDRLTRNQVPEHSEFYKRYHNFFFFDHPSLNPRGGRSPLIDRAAFEGVTEAFMLQNLGKKPIQVFHGSQFWVLTARTIAHVLRQYDTDWHLRKSFQYSALSDELLIQSVVGNFVPNAGKLPGPVFADFSKGHGPILYSDVQHLPTTVEETFLFIRKISPKAPEFSRHWVDRLLNGEPLYENGTLNIECK